MQAHEAWAEYRRTGFPNLIVLPGETITLDQNQFEALTNADPTYVFIPRVDIDEMPQRLRYPQILQTLNEASRAAAAQALGGDLITSPLFWDVN